MRPDRKETEVSASLPLEEELVRQIEWFIRQRWASGAGSIALFWVMRFVLNLPLPLLPLYAISGSVLAYNFLFHQYAQKLEATTPHRLGSFSRFANLQIVVDWGALTLVVHYSGGIESPLIFFFIFHVIISTILLSQRAAYLQTTLAAFLITILALIEYYRIIPHFHVLSILSERLYRDPGYLLTFLLFFTGTLYMSTYLTGSVSKRLREREKDLVMLKKNLEEAYHKLEESDVAKSEFVLMVTHELRSPLSAIKSILGLFSQGYTGELSNEQRELARGIEQRTRFLLSLVGDLRHLAKVKADRFKKEKTKIDLREIVERVGRSLQAGVKNKHLDLRIDLPPSPVMFWGNDDEMELLFSNLMGNSVKYTPSRGNILVKMVEENSQIRTEISDTGIGISAEDLFKIFDEFYRAKNAKKIVKEGTGLGLSIAKRIVETYGGRIEAKSTPGLRTTFIFYLPTQEEWPKELAAVSESLL